MWWHKVVALLCAIFLASPAQYIEYVPLFDVALSRASGTKDWGTFAAGESKRWGYPTAFAGITTAGYFREFSNAATAGRQFAHRAPAGSGSVNVLVTALWSDASVTVTVNGTVVSQRTVAVSTVEVFSGSWHEKSTEISSDADVLVASEVAGEYYTPLLPVAETVYGQCSRYCSIQIWGGDTSVPIERTCTDGTVVNVQAGVQSEVGAGLYEGETCKWTVSGGNRISGFAHSDGSQAEAAAFVPPEYFQERFRLSSNVDFLLFISTGPALCTFGSHTPVQLTGASGVYHARLSRFTYHGNSFFDCDLPVTAVGDAECPNGGCSGIDMNFIGVPMPTTTATTLTSTTATNTTTTATTTSSSSSTTVSATTTTATTTTATATSATTTTTCSTTVTTLTMSITSTTTTSSSNSSTTTTSVTRTTTTFTSTTPTTTTYTTSTSATTTSTTTASTTSTSATTTSTTTMSLTSTSTTTTSTTTTTTATTTTTTTTMSTSSSTSTSTGSATETTTSTSKTDTTVTATNTTTTTSESSTTTSNTSSATWTTLSATNTTATPTTSATPATANELPAAALVKRVDSLEATVLAALSGQNETSFTQRVDGITLVASKLDVAAVAAAGNSLTVPPQNSKAKVTVPASLFSSLDHGTEEVVVLTVASLDVTTKDFTGNGSESEEQVAAVVVVNLLTLDGRRLNVSGLADPIRVTMEVNESGSLQCVYWDEDTSEWATTGMETGSADGGVLKCWSTHLTLFAAIFRGFVNTLACSQVSLLSAESLKELAKGDWHQTTGALVFASVLGTFAMLLLLAAWLDRSRWNRGMSHDEHLLIPLQAAVEDEGQQGQPQDHDGGASRGRRGPFACAVGCIVAGAACLVDWCRSSSALRDALDEVVSQWASHFGEIRSMIEGLTGGLDLCGEGAPRMVTLVHRLMSTTMVTSARRQVAASLSISWDVSTLVLEDEHMPNMAETHRARSRLDVEAGPAANHLRRGVSTTTLAREAAWGQLHRDMDAKLDKIMEASARWSSLPLTVCRLYMHQNPITTCVVHCSFTSCKQRVLFFMVDLVGALTLATVFYSASGVPTKWSRNLECEFRSPGEFVGRMVAIGTGSVLVSGIPAILLGSFCTRTIKKMPYEGSPAWKKQLAKWRTQDKIIWFVGLLYVAFCTLFICIFLANVHQRDHGEWLLGILVSLVQDLLLIPLSVAFTLAFLTTACLHCMSHHRKTTTKELVGEVQWKLKRRANMDVLVGTI